MRGSGRFAITPLKEKREKDQLHWLVLLLLALFGCGIGKAHALDTHPTREAAWTHCQEGIPNLQAVYPGHQLECVVSDIWIPGYHTQRRATSQHAWTRLGDGYAHVWSAECPAGQNWNEATKKCDVPCAQRPPLGNLHFQVSDAASAPSTVCKDGCSYIKGNNIPVWWEIDGQTYVSVEGWMPNEATCSVETSFTPPPLDGDNDGCSNGNDAFPSDPNECTDSDDDGVGDNGDIDDEDPTDGADGEGEEDGDDEGDNTASGGGTCAAPPSCAGDGIQCNMLWQTWKARCDAPEKTTVTGVPEECSGVYTCAGDGAQCAQIALLRKTACAVSGPGGGEGGNVPGDGNGNGQPDWTEGGGPAAPGEGEDGDGTDFNVGFGPNLLDTGDLFGGGSCPQLPSFQIMGVSVGGGDITQWCAIVAIMRAVVLIMGAFIALRVLMGD